MASSAAAPATRWAREYETIYILRPDVDNAGAEKIVDRAKGILMQRTGISEDEAYRRLNKTARDSNRKLRDVAQSVLTAEDLLRPGSD